MEPAAIAHAIGFCRRMMRVHLDDDARKRRPAELAKETVQVAGDAIEVIIGIYFAKARGLDVPRASLGRRNSAFVHASASATRRE